MRDCNVEGTSHLNILLRIDPTLLHGWVGLRHRVEAAAPVSKFQRLKEAYRWRIISVHLLFWKHAAYVLDIIAHNSEPRLHYMVCTKLRGCVRRQGWLPGSHDVSSFKK